MGSSQLLAQLDLEDQHLVMEDMGMLEEWMLLKSLARLRIMETISTEEEEGEGEEVTSRSNSPCSTIPQPKSSKAPKIFTTMSQTNIQTTIFQKLDNPSSFSNERSLPRKNSETFLQETTGRLNRTIIRMGTTEKHSNLVLVLRRLMILQNHISLIPAKGAGGTQTKNLPSMNQEANR